MPNNICPLCKQVLQAGVTAHSLHQKLNQIELAAQQAAEKAAEKTLAAEIRKAVEADRKLGEAKIAKTVAKAVADALAEERQQNRKDNAARERQHREEMAEAKALAEVGERELKKAAAEARAEVRVEEQAKRLKEKNVWQTEIDDLKRRLEKKTAGELGDEGEADLPSELREAYPEDRILTKGRSGADTTQIVMDEDGKKAGLIVYETKNTLGFNASFIKQVREQRTQAGAEFAVIVSRKVPSKAQANACAKDGITVLEPRHVATAVAGLREAVLLLARLRLAQVDTDPKAQQMLAYINSVEYRQQDRDIDNAIAGLNKLQQDEKDWHERHWKKEDVYQLLIGNRRRQVREAMRSIADAADNADRKAPGRVVNGDASRWAAAD